MHLSTDSSAAEYFNKLKTLIEETYAKNANKRVSLLCHSMGCPYSLVFLNEQPLAWKDKFILQWITLSGQWWIVFLYVIHFLLYFPPAKGAFIIYERGGGWGWVKFENFHFFRMPPKISKCISGPPPLPKVTKCIIHAWNLTLIACELASSAGKSDSIFREFKAFNDRRTTSEFGGTCNEWPQAPSESPSEGRRELGTGGENERKNEVSELPLLLSSFSSLLPFVVFPLPRLSKHFVLFPVSLLRGYRTKYSRLVPSLRMLHSIRRSVNNCPPIVEGPKTLPGKYYLSCLRRRLHVNIAIKILEYGYTYKFFEK